ncbi:MAG: hypothetical protein AB1898_25250 [Acidobacteriota bacterium]
MRFLPGLLMIAFALPTPHAVANTSSQISSESRMRLIRTLGSEFVSPKVPLPINKKGLMVDRNGDFDWKKNEEASLSAGQFIAPGITVQITKITFEGDRLIFELNGGGRKKKKRFLERIQIGAGGGTRPIANPTAQAPPQGSYVSIKFDQSIPELTPDQVKDILNQVLDFSRKSALKSFVDSVPEEFKEAAKNKQAAVGMDKDLVLATLGRPLKRVREKRGEAEIEEWIYGERPHKIIFVTFSDGKVISVKEY